MNFRSRSRAAKSIYCAAAARCDRAHPKGRIDPRLLRNRAATTVAFCLHAQRKSAAPVIHINEQAIKGRPGMPLFFESGQAWCLG
jgi:hypothetical protein